MKKKINIGNLDLGFLTEKKIQTKLIEKDFLTLEPVIESGTIDLLSYKNNIFKRLQCKTAVYNRSEDRFSCPLLRTEHQKYDLNEIDFFAIYIHEMEIVYFIPSNKKILGGQSLKFYPHRKKRFDRKIYIDYENFRENFNLLEKKNLDSMHMTLHSTS